MKISERLAYLTRHQKFVDVRDLYPFITAIEILEVDEGIEIAKERDLYKKALSLACIEMSKGRDCGPTDPEYYLDLVKILEEELK
jgi:hypothetical protein